MHWSTSIQFREDNENKVNDKIYCAKYVSNKQWNNDYSIQNYVNVRMLNILYFWYSGIIPNSLHLNGTHSYRSNTFEFGLCFPVTCSMDFLQKHLKIGHPMNERISINLHENTCQVKKGSELRTIDWVTM